MLLGAIGEIIGLSILFFVCSILCYILFKYMLKDERKDDNKPEIEKWQAKFYYDPLPAESVSPPDILLKPSVYSFKVLNGNTPYAQAHAVINPAVLQYPPGHVLAEQHLVQMPLAMREEEDDMFKNFRGSQSRSDTTLGTFIPPADSKTRSSVTNGSVRSGPRWIT